MANTTNFGWETPDDTDLVKDGALAIRTLGSAIDTSLVDLKGGTTGQILVKSTNTDMDFSWSTAATGGKVLQVVSATYSTQTINSTTSYADTGLTATITPTANTSKVLCLVSQAGIYKQLGADNYCYVQLLRNGTSIIEFEKSGGRTETTATNSVATASTAYLDSPATTSAVTYKTEFKSQLASGASVRVQANSGVSTITLLEIGA